MFIGRDKLFAHHVSMLSSHQLCCYYVTNRTSGLQHFSALSVITYLIYSRTPSAHKFISKLKISQPSVDIFSRVRLELRNPNSTSTYDFFQWTLSP